MTLDVVIPLHAKDLEILPWCVRGIRRHVEHRRLYVVAAASLEAAVRQVAPVTFVDEDTVVPDISLASFDHWSWYFQQILKLGMAARLDGDFYLTVDADTVFVRDVTMLDGDRALWDYRAHEPHRPSLDAFEALTGLTALADFSFVAHHMVFARPIVLEMLRSFVGRGSWVEQIVEIARGGGEHFMPWNFSEFDTFGNYVWCRHRDRVRLRKLSSVDMPRPPERWRLLCLRRRCDYASFHHYVPSSARVRLPTLFARLMASVTGKRKTRDRA